MGVRVFLSVFWGGGSFETKYNWFLQPIWEQVLDFFVRWMDIVVFFFFFSIYLFRMVCRFQSNGVWMQNINRGSLLLKMIFLGINFGALGLGLVTCVEV